MTTVLPARAGTRYRTRLATCAADVAAAQRLRRRVFAEECGALLAPSADGRDVDEWDGVCDHLLVVVADTDEVVGTYRLLPPERARALGRTYGDAEFDLSRHAALRPTTAEAGRSCVAPGHRSGAVIDQLWAGIARYVLERDLTHLAGCTSVPLADGGATAAAVWDLVRLRYLAPAPLRVVPHVPFDVEVPPRPDRAVLPPLVRGYLALGARVCGRPAHDPLFGTADFYTLLSVADVPARVLRRLTEAAR
ncbi:GNAT family N-acetyltransferase [Geodermatophilus sp. SYSU D00815]